MAAKPFASGHILDAADVNDLTGILDRSTSTVDVVSTVTETTIYTFSVPANAMSTNRMLRLTMIGDVLNNDGTNRQFTVRIKFGATTMYGRSPM